jgi:Mg2+/Co2+ transporter CorB
MSGIAKVDATLVGSLVAAILKTYDTLASTHLFFREVTNILLSFLGTNARLSIITRLKTEIELFD